MLAETGPATLSAIRTLSSVLADVAAATILAAILVSVVLAYAPSGARPAIGPMLAHTGPRRYTGRTRQLRVAMLADNSCSANFAVSFLFAVLAKGFPVAATAIFAMSKISVMLTNSAPLAALLAKESANSMHTISLFARLALGFLLAMAANFRHVSSHLLFDGLAGKGE